MKKCFILSWLVLLFCACADVPSLPGVESSSSESDRSDVLDSLQILGLSEDFEGVLYVHSALGWDSLNISGSKKVIDRAFWTKYDAVIDRGVTVYARSNLGYYSATKELYSYSKSVYLKMNPYRFPLIDDPDLSLHSSSKHKNGTVAYLNLRLAPFVDTVQFGTKVYCKEDPVEIQRSLYVSDFGPSYSLSLEFEQGKVPDTLHCTIGDYETYFVIRAILAGQQYSINGTELLGSDRDSVEICGPPKDSVWKYMKIEPSVAVERIGGNSNSSSCLWIVPRNSWALSTQYKLTLKMPMEVAPQWFFEDTLVFATPQFTWIESSPMIGERMSADGKIQVKFNGRLDTIGLLSHIHITPATAQMNYTMDSGMRILNLQIANFSPSQGVRIVLDSNLLEARGGRIKSEIPLSFRAVQ